MKKSKKNIFDKNDLQKFLDDSNLMLKPNALSRVKGGGLTYTNYAESTFVNYVLPGPIGG